MTDTQDDDTNPRAQIGANNPPIPERLAVQYQEILTSAVAIAARANAAPAKIESDEDHETINKLIKDARAADKSLESHRKAEKDPYLKQADEVDGVFVQPRDRMRKIVEAMNLRVTRHLQAKEAAERARQQEQARIARKVVAIRKEFCICTHDEIIDTLAMVLALHVAKIGWPADETLDRFSQKFDKARTAALKRIPVRRGATEEKTR